MAGWQLERRDGRLAVRGELRIADAPAIWRALADAAAGAEAGGALDLDLADAELVDGAVMALLVGTREALVARGVRCELVGASPQLEPLVELYRGDRPPLRPPPPAREPPIERLGAAVARGLRPGRQLVELTGELVASVGAIARRPASGNWRGLPALVERAGTDALPIVLLLNFLIGCVMAFQSLAQLRLYGANIYVADIVGLSITRELAPLMTAIIMSGRSGAAYAAELGTMRVSEETDALRTMGIDPVAYLVVPRVLALALVAPMLTLLGAVVGVLGGVVIAAVSLDVTPHAFLTELRTMVGPIDVVSGLIKSVVFGAAIGLIGCQRGLATRGAASEVGRATTATVVYCLFTLVIVDTLLTAAYQQIGWV